MSARSAFVVDVRELRERPGSRVAVDVEGELLDVVTSTAELIDGRGHLAVDLESFVGGVSATGVASGRFRGACRRCLEPVEGDYETEVDEIFEDTPTEGESYGIVDEQVDLAVLARDALILALPLAPLCRPDCAGPDPDRFPTQVESDAAPASDPRWAALGELSFE